MTDTVQKPPEGVKELDPQPTCEFHWFDVIEQLGYSQWWLNHSMADGRISDNDDNRKALKQTNEALVYFGAIIAEKYNLILPDACPKGAKWYKPGEVIPDSTRKAYLAFGDTEELPAVMPAPPEGKVYWWQWYRKMKAFDETIQPDLEARCPIDTKALCEAFCARWDYATETLRPDLENTDAAGD